MAGPSRKWRHAVLAGSILSAVAAVPEIQADILDKYTFGPDGSNPGILDPTTVAPNVTATPISADAGLVLDLTSPATQPTTTPYLRTTFVTLSTTAAAAVSNSADFKFTLSANAGALLNLTSLNFDAMRGGAGTPRGYDVRSSVDNFATSLSGGDLPTARPTFTNINVDLSGAAFQNLSTITFKIFSYSPATGSSVDYDSFVVNGTVFILPVNGYTWKGSLNNQWDTTSANWTGLGTTYVDNTATSDVVFDDTASTFNVNVTPAALKPHSMTLSAASASYVFSGSSLTVAAGINKSGTGSATINNIVSAANVTVGAGTLTIGTTGQLTSPLISITSGATLAVSPGGALGATSGVIANGAFNLGGPAQTLATLDGATTGVVTLGGTILTITGTSAYAGQITGAGSLLKTTGGSLTLSGTSDFSGGIVVNGGSVLVASASGAGTGGITVNSGGRLGLAAAVANPITLAGGTLGASGGGAAPSGNLTVTAPSTVDTFNPASGAVGNDVILTGTLQGSGNITLATVNGNSPDSAAFRLRGPGSTYTGNITIPQSGKFELQTSASSGSPMGTGTLIVTGGTTGTNANGTFSIINLRNSTTGDVSLGNNVQVAGTGSTFLNLLGGAPAGSVFGLGDLSIGDGQTIATVASTAANITYAVGFSSVHLNGGNATFTASPIGNTSYLATENILLSTITQNVPGSGITANGSATLTLAGVSTYTGPTTINWGTVVLTGSIAGSATTINAGTLQGTGTAGAVTLAGGVIAPGSGPGTLRTGALTLNGGTVAMEITGPTLGNGFGNYDQLAVTGTVSLNNQIALTLDFSTYDPVDFSDKFVLIDNDGTDPVALSAAGRFTYNSAPLNEGAVFTAQSGAFSQIFKITYAGGSGGNDVLLSAVPEPGAASLMIGAAGLVCGLRRRRGVK